MTPPADADSVTFEEMAAPARDQLRQQPASAPPLDLEAVYDVPVRISVILGRAPSRSPAC